MRVGETDLPDHWFEMPLGEVADVQLGKMLDRKRREGERLPYLRNINVRWGSIDTSDLLEMHFREKELERYSLREGDVLVCEGGEPGRSAVWRSGSTEIKYQKALHRVRFAEGVLSDWLVYQLMLDAGLGRLERRFTGTTIKHFTRVALRRYPLRIAPLPEQRRIVEAIETHFSRLDAAVAALERARANLRRYRASVLKAACEGRLVPTEEELARREGRDYEPAQTLLERILAERRRRWEEAELEKLIDKGKKPQGDAWKKRYKEPEPPRTEELPPLPGGWCWATVEQLGLVTGGLTKNPKRDRLPTRLPYLRVANVYADELRLDDVQTIGVRDAELDRVLLRSDDLLVVEGNGSLDQLGRVALWDGSVSPCVHQNHLIKVRFVETDLARYVLYWLLSYPGREQIVKVASSTAGLYNLSLSKVSALAVALPPLAEQVRIAEEVERRMSLLDAVEHQNRIALRRAERLRQSILKRAFEGKLVPQDPSDEPASVLLERIHAERGET